MEGNTTCMNKRFFAAALFVFLSLCLCGLRAANVPIAHGEAYPETYLNCEEYRSKHPDQMSTLHVLAWSREGDIWLDECPREFECDVATMNCILVWRCTICKSRNFMEIERRETRVLAHSW